MSNNICLGVDNGVLSLGGIIYPNKPAFCFQMPVKKQQDYTKKKKNITRVDNEKLQNIIIDNVMMPCSQNNWGLIAALERPYINPGGFNASIIAARALESVLIIFERLKIPFEFMDSKTWQKELLPEGLKDRPELKKASKTIGTRLFPHLEHLFKEDADGMLIAEYLRRRDNNEL